MEKIDDCWPSEDEPHFLMAELKIQTPRSKLHPTHCGNVC